MAEDNQLGQSTGLLYQKRPHRFLPKNSQYSGSLNAGQKGEAVYSTSQLSHQPYGQQGLRFEKVLHGNFPASSLTEIMCLGKLLRNTGDVSAVVFAGIINIRKVRGKGCEDKILDKV